MPSLGLVFSVTFRIVLLRALNLAHFSDYFVRQPYIFWRELLRQQRESTTAFCSRRQQAEDLVGMFLVLCFSSVVLSDVQFCRLYVLLFCTFCRTYSFVERTVFACTAVFAFALLPRRSSRPVLHNLHIRGTAKPRDPFVSRSLHSVHSKSHERVIRQLG